jgi:hypothetical protein
MRNCLFPLAVVVAVWVCRFGIVVLAFCSVFRALGYSDHAHTLGVAFPPQGLTRVQRFGTESLRQR